MSETALPILHLDNSILVFGLRPGHEARQLITNWVGRRHRLAASAMAWAEFRCGPLDPASAAAWETMLAGQVVPVDQAIADLAAELFNRTGRRSRSLPDCLIAATAMTRGARLATLNRADFEPLRRYGLELA